MQQQADAFPPLGMYPRWLPTQMNSSLLFKKKNEFIILIPTRIFGFSPLRQTCSRKSYGLPVKGVDNHSNSAWSISTDDSLLMFRSRNCADDVSRGKNIPAI